MPDPYLTQHEAAKLIGIRQRYLVRAVEIGEGPDVARIERSPYWMVRRSALLDWAREQGWQQSEAAD